MIPAPWWLIWGATALAVVAQTPKKGSNFSQAAVVSARSEASQAGAWCMAKGGNAADAAVVTHFMLAVCYPQAGNLGGGGFALVHVPGQPIQALDFRETAPKAAHARMFLDADGKPIPERSTQHSWAVGIPGSVHGLFTLHTSYGRLPWNMLLEPAIRCANEGFILTEKDAKEFNAAHSDLMQGNPDYPRFWKKEPWKPGDTLRQPELARTLKIIQQGGSEAWYEGPLAAQIVRDLKKRGGWHTEEDFAAYRTLMRKPVEANILGYRVVSMPPPSSGGYILLHMLKLLALQTGKPPQWLSSNYVRWLVEAERLAYADRSVHLGDPDFWTRSPDFLLNEGYILKRLALWPPAGKAGQSSNISPGVPTKEESEQTTHFSVVDPSGMSITLTTTINSPFGARIAHPEAGFLYNNEMDDFSVAPGVPNQFGLLGAEANAVAPGKRMLSAMTPTFVFRGNQLVLVTGTPGGATIITSIFQQLVSYIWYKKSVLTWQQAPRFHHQWQPDVVYMEEMGWPESVVKALRQMGYALKKRPPIGRVNAIERKSDGNLEAGADPRGDDAAWGF
jgi:gamma-glutamyltranspeptidase / glutathione hydrolase